MDNKEIENKTEVKVSATTAVSASLSDALEEKKPEVVIGPSQRALQKDFSDMLRIYVLPIVVIVVFLLFLVLGILPNISKIFGSLEELSVVNEEYNSKATEFGQLQTVSKNLSKIENDLKVINNIVGTDQTEVVLYQEQISKLAKDSGLSIIEQSTNEKLLNLNQGTTASPTTPTLGIIEIESQFNLRGSLNDFRAFINGLNNIDDFLIIGEMKLNSTELSAAAYQDPESVEWLLEIDLIKYQFQVPDEANKLKEVFKRIPITAQPNAEVIEFIENKLGTTENTN